MPLKDQTIVSAVWTDSAVRATNTSGTPLTSAADYGSGEAISDEYTLAISAVGGGTCTVTVQTLAPNNPYNGQVYTGVAIDGVTVYRNIVPGAALVFSGTAANGNTALVRVGIYAGTFDAFGGGAGVPSAGVRHRVVNDGTGAVSNAKARVLNHAVQVRIVGHALEVVRPFAAAATEKTAGGGSNRVMPYVITLANVTGSGGAKTADFQVDGVTLGAATLTDLSTGLAVSGTAVKALGNYFYRVASGPLTGLEFAVAADCATGDEANVLIFQARFVQIAPDNNGGAEPVSGWGVSDVVLTQAGQAAGVIQPAGVAYYWTRIVVPSGGSAESNPQPANIALTATETGAAGWTA